MFGVLALILALTGTPIQSMAASADVDVVLVLAVDISGSMDGEEARVQRSGYVEALRHLDVISAVKSGYLGRIAIGYFEWAGMVNEESVLAWQVIEDAEDADAFASKLEARPLGTRRATSISNAILFGTNLITSYAFSGARRILDISGDGPNNTGPPVTWARSAALERPSMGWRVSSGRPFRRCRSINIMRTAWLAALARSWFLSTSRKISRSPSAKS